MSQTEKQAAKYTLAAKIGQAAAFKTLVAAVSKFVEEASFDAAGEEVAFRAMDPSHVALLDVHLPAAGFFEKYDLIAKTQFTVRVEDLAKIVKRSEPKDACSLRVTDEGMDISFQNGYRRDFKLHLIDTAAGATPIPKLSFNAIAQVGQIKKILQDIAVVSDHVKLQTREDGKALTFSGKSDAGSATIDLTKDNANLTDLTVKETSTATYSISYIQSFIEAVEPEACLIEYSSKMPLRLTVKQFGAEYTFYLAPRLDEK